MQLINIFGGGMSLIEREEELARLRELLTESASGKGRVVVVNGSVASGKTELLFSFAEHASEQKAVVLSAVADRVGHAVPTSALRQLLQDAPFEPAANERLRSLLSRIGLASSTEQCTSAEQALRVQLMHDLWSVLLRLSVNQPVLLLIDDVEYVDHLSLECLLYFIRRLRSTRIMIVFSVSDQARWTPPIFHTELLRQPHYDSIRLKMLSERGVSRVLAEQFDSQAADLATACYLTSGGNPLLLRALVEDHRAAMPDVSTHPAELLAGRALARAVLTCLRRGAPAMLDVARGLAVFGDEVSPGLLGELLGIEAITVRQLLDDLDAVGVLGNWRFRHPIVQSAVLEEMTGQERGDLRHRAAERLHHDGASAISVARQLIAAGRVDESWGLHVLREAAESALSQDDTELAVQCLRLAYRVSESEEQRATLAAAIARAEWRVNPLGTIPHLDGLSAALRAGHLPNQPVLALARYQLWHGQFDGAVESLKHIGGFAGELDAVTTGLFRATQDWLRCSYPSAFERLPPVGGIRTCIGTSARKQVYAASLLTDVLTRSPDEAALRDAEQTLRGMQLGDDTVEIIQSALLALVYASQIDQAARWCKQLCREAIARRAPTWQALLSAVRAEIAFRRGNLVSADRHATAALAHFPLRSWGIEAGVPLGSLVLANTAMGKYEKAGEQLGKQIPEATFLTRAGLHYLYARGNYNLAVDRLDTALDDFFTCGEQMMRWRIDQPGLVPWRTDAAVVYLRGGDLNSARRLVEAQLARPGGRTGRILGISLRVLAATQAPPKRLELLHKAVDALRANGDQLELARALTSLCQAHRALGQVSLANVVMSEALQLAKKCWAGPLRNILTASDDGVELRRAHRARPIGNIDSLSDAERRVVSCASMGNTNREIASKLYITVSTVEQHLTRAYRKLNVSRRTDLPQGVQFDVVNTA